MKNIEFIKDFEINPETSLEKDKVVTNLYDGPFRKLVEVRLQNDAVLPKHKANEPITVFCLSGNGVFRAGNNLEESQDLRAGRLITLAGGVEHEVVAAPALHLIVTKFKDC